MGGLDKSPLLGMIDEQGRKTVFLPVTARLFDNRFTHKSLPIKTR